MKKTALLSTTLALTCLLPVASHAGKLSWYGKVDNISIIRIHHRSVSVQNIRGKGVSDETYFVTGALTRRIHHVSLRHAAGPGSIRIVQQPGPRNDYTAAVRITDLEPGRAPYRFTLEW